MSEEFCDVYLAEEPGQALRSSIRRYFIMLHFLRSSNKRQVGGQFIFFLSLRNDLLTFFDETHHPLTGLGLRLFTEHAESVLEALYMTFRLHQMFFEGLFQLWMVRRVHHLWQGFRQLSLGIQQIFQLILQEFFHLCHKLFLSMNLVRPLAGLLVSSSPCRGRMAV